MRSEPDRLLDIGTARGGFLSVMQEGGWEAVGIEPFHASQNPYGVEIHHCSFPEECPLPDGHYDVITAWVFEHLRDPAAAFRKAAALLRRAGG